MTCPEGWEVRAFPGYGNMTRGTKECFNLAFKVAAAKQLEHSSQALENKMTTASLSCRTRKQGWGGVRKAGQKQRAGS